MRGAGQSTMALILDGQRPPLLQTLHGLGIEEIIWQTGTWIDEGEKIPETTLRILPPKGACGSDELYMSIPSKKTTTNLHKNGLSNSFIIS